MIAPALGAGMAICPAGPLWSHAVSFPRRHARQTKKQVFTPRPFA